MAAFYTVHSFIYRIYPSDTKYKKADCIRQTFRKLNLTALAKQSGFRERKSRKISPLNFVLALLAMASKGALSLGKEAELIGFLANRTISRQAVQKCAKKATAFMTLVLLKLLELKAYGPVGRAVPNCMRSFERVLIVDSTSIGLPKALAPFFPGASNQTGSKQAQLKIQAYYDLRNESFVDFSLSSFRKNDQAASKDILAVAQPNDLILRDLGYFVLDLFKQLDQRGCFFVSRLKTGTCLLANEGDEELDLRKLLRGQKLLDMPVRVGKKAKLPVRLIAVKLPQKVAHKRRHKHRKNRDNRLRYTSRTSFLLGFQIFITNLHQKDFSPKQILSFYGPAERDGASKFSSRPLSNILISVRSKRLLPTRLSFLSTPVSSSLPTYSTSSMVPLDTIRIPVCPLL